MKKLVTALALLAVLASCKSKPSETHTSKDSIAAVKDWALLPFEKIDSVNPVLTAGSNSFTCPILKKQVAWESKDVFNPAVVVRNDTVFMLYRAEDTIGKYAGTSRIGLAWSTDAVHFTRLPAPVFYPDNDACKKYEWEGGCEDPRIVQDSAGTYYMTYTAYDGKIARLLVASSKNLLQWQKHGPVFAKTMNGKYKDLWGKSGSIVSEYKNGNITAVKINGKYWMYWGDTYIFAATSDDLINWQPVELPAGQSIADDSMVVALNLQQLQPVIKTRRGKFDSNIVESGPPAMLTGKGILLLYNARNVPAIGDTSLVEGTYAPSQVLLDKANPTAIIDRMDTYFMKPEKPYETTGQVNQVCFIEGLVEFKNAWWLYYGTADSKIAVAVHK
ncbi:glycoside hydrolase family 130 protein [Foetidibacter luteolus]|uniref:glycoside hydrolase family 130 protein n=1 Tax=Foetidibacter luteolus TaxID=2608880 RepID=UPI00129B84C7|nr:glycoside hydrolase family 130 protein [Foetidibacter luteolus]